MIDQDKFELIYLGLEDIAHDIITVADEVMGILKSFESEDKVPLIYTETMDSLSVMLLSLTMLQQKLEKEKNEDD